LAATKKIKKKKRKKNPTRTAQLSRFWGAS